MYDSFDEDKERFERLPSLDEIMTAAHQTRRALFYDKIVMALTLGMFIFSMFFYVTSDGQIARLDSLLLGGAVIFFLTSVLASADCEVLKNRLNLLRLRLNMKLYKR